MDQQTLQLLRLVLQYLQQSPEGMAYLAELSRGRFQGGQPSDPRGAVDGTPQVSPQGGVPSAHFGQSFQRDPNGERFQQANYSPAPWARNQGGQGRDARLPMSVPSGQTFTTRSTGYSPNNNAMEGGVLNRYGQPLYTLSQYLDDIKRHGRPKRPFSVAMDKNLTSFRKSKLYFHELSRHYGVPVVGVVDDTGGAFTGKGTSRVDLSVGYAHASNGHLRNSRLMNMNHTVTRMA